MKQQVLLILFLTINLTLIAQEYHENDLVREIPKFHNSNLKTITIRDSLDNTPFVSYMQHFNKDGLNIYEFELNRKGDTIESIKTSYPDKMTEVQIHSYRNLPKDTVWFTYNEKGKLLTEMWKWGDNGETDKYIYHYDNNEHLVKQEMYYGSEKSWDTLLYVNNKLKSILSYDSTFRINERDSLIYNSENKLVEIINYNFKNELSAKFTFDEIETGKYKKVTKEYYQSDNTNINKKYISTYEYYSNGDKKYKLSEFYKNGILQSKSEIHYSELGFFESVIIHDMINDHVTEQKTTLHKQTQN